MIDRPQRTYRRVRSKYYGETTCRAPLIRDDPEHLARIAAHTERVQSELLLHPPDAQRRYKEARADRRTLLVYLVEQGGRSTKRWITGDLGWDYRRVERAVKLGAWFARERGMVWLTPAGWAAAKEHS